jgi:hypothetical protein
VPGDHRAAKLRSYKAFFPLADAADGFIQFPASGSARLPVAFCSA